MTISQQIQKFSKYDFNDTSFKLLMQKRIYHILLICSSYDAFVLEEDGRIDEQIFNEYVSLNLRYPPQFIKASTPEEAFSILKDGKIDLIITMMSMGDVDPFKLSKKIKQRYPNKPIVVLTPFSREVSIKVKNEKFPYVDYIFCWLGNADIMLAIIKLIEDKMNAEYDIDEIGVQAILLVEDSVRFYSSYLPNLYKIIFNQSKDFMIEGLNEHQKMLRMRGRPKILLATNYEEAITFFSLFKHNLLGVISDIAYDKDGTLDEKAGIKLYNMMHKEDKFLPFILQSSDEESEKIAKSLNVGFINKYSKTLSLELKEYVDEEFAFGDFIFRDPKTRKEISRAFDLQSLQQKIFEVPDESLKYHIDRNHISKWLKARALFPLGDMFREDRRSDFRDLDEIRRYIYDNIGSFRLQKGRGIIAEFDKEKFDEYFIFSRIGRGSIGGKARGLAFIDSLIKRNNLLNIFPGVILTIPRTVVLSTDVFDEFMERNHLYQVALSNSPDEEILKAFIAARLPVRIHEDMLTFMQVCRNPIAIRSSSLLEDSHYQPFAGVYSTYMVPKIENNEILMLEMLGNAIKSVYASVFFRESKAYMTATSNVIDEERMGIVLQEVTGKAYQNRFYPAISGVARSINFYPIEFEKPEDGVANIAFGLGKYIVDGGRTLRFSPKYPKKILQLTNPQLALRESQKEFYALDLNSNSFIPSVDDGINIMKLRLSEAENDSALRYVASTYDFQNSQMRDGMHDGKKVVTFSNVLKHDVFPLAEILETILEIGHAEMNKHIEIEFAVDLDTPKDTPKVFSYLQIRPIVETDQTVTLKWKEIVEEDTIIISNSALGNGIMRNIVDFVYVKPETFSAGKSNDIASELEKLNEKLVREGRNYILVGPGRWGSSDPWLGIPVKWAQISNARVIVESGLTNYRIDPSQGTHFFQNLTSFRIGYLTINPYINDGFYNVDYLNSFTAHYENEFIRHIRFPQPMKVKIDGKISKGVIYKPKLEG
jgi:CheY-like chemotaxis protein